ncbi:MAG: hypothetical protein ACHQ50_08725 [Fimbriimonadales bacterium]
MGTPEPNGNRAKAIFAIAIATLGLLALSTMFFPVEHIRVLRSAGFLGLAILAIGGRFILQQFSGTVRRVWLAILFVFLFALPVHWLIQGLMDHDTAQIVFGIVTLGGAVAFTVFIARSSKQTTSASR